MNRLTRRAVLRLFGLGGVVLAAPIPVSARPKPKRAESTYGDGRYGHGVYGST